MRRRVACRLQTRQTRGGPWGVRGGFGQNLAGTRRSSRKAPSPTEGHRRVLSSRHGILCEERTGGSEEASHFITAEKTTRGVERGEIFARAFQTRRSRAKAISAHPGPGGVAGIKGDVRRLDEYAPGMLSAHRGRIPRANSGQSEHWLEARVEQYVEQCGAVSRSVDVSFLVFSSCHGSNISWPAHPTDTLQPIFAVNLSQQFFAYPPA